MKTSFYRAACLMVIVALSACSRYDYYTAGLNKTNMSQYRSFAWLSPQGKTEDRPTASAIADLKIKDAAVASLTNKGLRMQKNNPDLLVTYTAKVGLGSKTVYYPTYYGTGFYPGFGIGYGWGYRPYYWGWGGPAFVYYGGMTAVDKEHYKEGTIIIDLIDTRTRRVVWRGFGVGEVHRNVQKNIDDIPKIVEGIIDQLNTGAPGTKTL